MTLLPYRGKPVAAIFAFAICGLISLCVPTKVQADFTLYDIDISEAGDVNGNTIRVFGTVTLDPDVVDTSNAISGWSLFAQQNGGTPVELTAFENMGGEFIDFVEVGEDLFVKGLGQNNEFMRWTGPGQTTFFFGSGPNNDAVFAEFGDDFWARTNVNGNGYRLGSVSSVPEPGSAMIAFGFAGIAIIRRRRRN